MSKKTPSGSRVLHLDAFSGAAGNMFLGAMLDLGLSKKALLEGLEPLGVDFKLIAKKVERSGFAARYVDVRLPKSGSGPRKRRKQAKANKAAGHDHSHSHPHGRRYAEIRDLIANAALEPRAQTRALEIFEALAKAEAKVHGTAAEDVHFHEVGAVDAIVDVTGAALALELMQIDRVTCSPVALGHGTIDSDHGLLPLPAPATIELLRGIPTVPSPVAWETVTPTGAAILKTVVSEFGWMPAMTIDRIGYGAGNDRKGALPNVLRGVLGQAAGAKGDRVVCIETNLDDLVPEHFDYLMERLFEEGALDVSIQHLQMKKNRPGFLLRVLATPATRDALARTVFAESTAIGVRLAEWDRIVLERESRKLKTKDGTLRIKIIRDAEGQRTFSPEYDDCKRVARSSGRPLREVIAEAAAQAAREWDA